MSHFAIATKERTSGREMRTDGLHSHLGLVDTSTLRVSGMGGAWPPSGAGIEMVYGATPDTGRIHAYDRTRAMYTDLEIAARNLSLITNGGGSLVLPPGSVSGAALAPGSVGTAAIAPNAVQQLLGQYTALPTFSVAAGTGYVETPVQVTVTPTTAGSLLRIEGQVTCTNNIANSLAYLALGADGAPSLVPSMFSFPASVNYPLSVAFVWYVAAPVGAHRYSVFLQSVVGTTSFYTATHQVLYVTEQKR